MMCSYTSSVITKASYSVASRAITSSSSRVNTLPVGFDGLHTMIALTPRANAASSTTGSNEKSGGSSGTKIGSAPDRMASAP